MSRINRATCTILLGAAMSALGLQVALVAPSAARASTTPSVSTSSSVAAMARPRLPSLLAPTVAPATGAQLAPIGSVAGPDTNGSLWKIKRTLNHVAGATNSALYGLSCPSSTACMAVGSFGSEVLNGGPSSTSVTLAESWNGEAWTAEATPDPAAATASELNAVWCSSTTACIAVGDYYDSAGNDSPLAETWNGTTWSIQTTPTPAGGTGAELWDMSCTSITACTAVGWSYLTGSDDFVTLAEVWNGTAWSIESTPNPAGSTDSALLGVWCSSATACTAVGDDKNSSGDYVSSAETWNGAALESSSHPHPCCRHRPRGGRDGRRVVHLHHRLHRRRQLREQLRRRTGLDRDLERHRLEHRCPPPSPLAPPTATWTGCRAPHPRRAPPPAATPTPRVPGKRWPRSGTAPPGASSPPPTQPAPPSAGCLRWRAPRPRRAWLSAPGSTTRRPTTPWRRAGTALYGRSSEPSTTSLAPPIALFTGCHARRAPPAWPLGLSETRSSTVALPVPA